MKKHIFTLALIFGFLAVFAQKPELVFVEGGSFYMGNDYSDALDEKPEHKVTLSDFYIGKYEVTFDEFDLFCRTTGYPFPDDGGFGRGKLPVMNVSWEGAILYCNWMSTRFGYDKVYDIDRDSTGLKIKEVHWDANGYRLPTEAEWEYVAKGGSKSQGYAYCGSNDPDEVAWYAKNSGGKPHEVGQKKPNELAVYDLLGNAWEWCWDYYDKNYYKNSPEKDPHGPDKGDARVYRGGNFKSEIEYLRITRRFSLSPKVTAGNVGFRLARTAIGEE